MAPLKSGVFDEHNKVYSERDNGSACQKVEVLADSRQTSASR